MNKIKQAFFLYKNSFIWAFILIIISGLGFVGVYYFGVMESESDVIETELTTIDVLEKSNSDTDSEDNEEDSNTIVKVDSSNLIKVDVKGKVKKPGVYEVESSYRVVDVIKKAGGLSKDADTSVTNLSKKVYDEMVIVIYSKAEVKNYESIKEVQKQNEQTCVNNEAVVDGACINSSSSKNESNISSSKVSINTDNIQELMTLSGIGESKAKQIISYRKSNGNFKNIEDIMNVEGIGESIFEKIKDNITT